MICFCYYIHSLALKLFSWAVANSLSFVSLRRAENAFLTWTWARAALLAHFYRFSELTSRDLSFPSQGYSSRHSGCHLGSFGAVTSSCVWHRPCTDLGLSATATREMLCTCRASLRSPPQLYAPAEFVQKPIFNTKEQSSVSYTSSLHTFYFWSVLLLYSWWEIKKIFLRLFWIPQKLQVAFCSEFWNFWSSVVLVNSDLNSPGIYSVSSLFCAFERLSTTHCDLFSQREWLHAR